MDHFLELHQCLIMGSNRHVTISILPYVCCQSYLLGADTQPPTYSPRCRLFMLKISGVSQQFITVFWQSIHLMVDLYNPLLDFRKSISMKISYTKPPKVLQIPHSVLLDSVFLPPFLDPFLIQSAEFQIDLLSLDVLHKLRFLNGNTYPELRCLKFRNCSATPTLSRSLATFYQVRVFVT
ncbi:hypothetical protein RCL1_008346 [Eukaryota sp. TZLM3-RCL]